jgi:hypothetical protein
VRISFSAGSYQAGSAVTWFLLAVGWGMFLDLPQATAAGTEVCDFVIRIDGKESGSYHVTTTRQEDGTETLVAQSDVRVTILGVPVYTYSYSGQEVWKGGRLQHFESTGKEKSKPFVIKAVLAGDLLHVTSNNTTHTVPADVWVTSCLKLPEPARQNGPIPMLGCDTGLVLSGQIQFVGQEQVSVAGQQQVCTHYRVTKNAIPYEVWYDGQERMVRQEWVSDGHRSVIELSQIRH